MSKIIDENGKLTVQDDGRRQQIMRQNSMYVSIQT